MNSHTISFLSPKRTRSGYFKIRDAGLFRGGDQWLERSDVDGLGEFFVELTRLVVRQARQHDDNIDLREEFF